MIQPPEYFARVKDKAKRQWEKLEADPELAAPWKQLFRQIQSPRHVISELLQNADDAGAKNVSVYVSGNEFVFSHDGVDFNEEQFASLCRFGYSNKRILHTIGFRGIGFKSTFSLGKDVRLTSPSLSICFNKERFTEPLWEGIESQNTKIIIRVDDEHRLAELRSSIDVWESNPISLRFFKSIEQLTVEGNEIYCLDYSPGPVPYSETFLVNDDQSSEITIFTSDAEAFPPDALKEIMEERMMDSYSVGSLDFPACEVNIVAGMESRLYSILPTGVVPNLPFACNAPFLQDPARMKIKDPSISATNRWILAKAGRFAARVMLEWLGNHSLGINKRAEAYSLLPEVLDSPTTIEETCQSIIAAAFFAEIGDRPCLLTVSGELAKPLNAISVPKTLFTIWDNKEILRLVESEGNVMLSGHVDEEYRNSLIRLKWIREIKKERILKLLTKVSLRRPGTQKELLNLWLYMVPEIFSYYRVIEPEKLRIIPVRNSDMLFPSDETVRMSLAAGNLEKDDQVFLESLIDIIDENWMIYLAKTQEECGELQSEVINEDSKKIENISTKLSILKPTPNDRLFDLAMQRLMKGSEVKLDDMVRLTRMAAKVSANVADSFCYVTQSNYIKDTEKGIVQNSAVVKELIPESYRDDHMMSDAYSASQEHCTPKEWDSWLNSGKSKIRSFPLPREVEKRFYTIKEAESEVLAHGFTGKFNYHYQKKVFLVADFDYTQDFWDHWQDISTNRPTIWADILAELLRMEFTYWEQNMEFKVVQYHSYSASRSIISSPLRAKWILRFSELPCFKDKYGNLRRPREMYRRTKETESLLDTEPFIDYNFNTERNLDLLDALGVQSKPESPKKLMEYLRQVAKAPGIPTSEFDKCYRRLDKYLEYSSTDDLKDVLTAFQHEKLILANTGEVTDSRGVFLKANEEDVPGAPLIRESVRDLALWGRLFIPIRPDLGYVLEWFRGLPTEVALSDSDQHRILALYARHGSGLVDATGKVLSMMGEMTSIESVKYWISPAADIASSHLFDKIRRKTANLTSLSDGIPLPAVASTWKSLAEVIENRIDPPVDGLSNLGTLMPWLSCAGELLARIKMSEMAKQEFCRALSRRMMKTQHVEVPAIKSIPYIEGVPAGTAKQMEAMWSGEVIYTIPMNVSKLAKILPKEIGNAFQNQDVTSALAYCFKRPAEEITSYIEENFEIESTIAYAEPAPMDTTPHQSELKVEELLGSVLATLENNYGLTKIKQEAGQEEEKTETSAESKRVHSGSQMPLIERFAIASGYRKVSDHVFKHEDGRSMLKTQGGIFPWEVVDNTGVYLKSYYAKECCLETGALELSSEVWDLIVKNPRLCSLILCDPDGLPKEHEGTALENLLLKKELVIYPATYRIVARDQ